MTKSSAATPYDSREFSRDEIGFLFELSNHVASTIELQAILDWVCQKVAALLRADEGAMKLLGPDLGLPTAVTLAAKPAEGPGSGSWEKPVSMSVMGYLLHKSESLATPDITQDARFVGLRGYSTRVRSVLAVPLRVENRVTGMLAVTQRTPGRNWTRDEIQLLEIVGSHSASVIEQARLRAEAVEKKRLEQEQQQMERELNLARDIQMGLVPSAPLRLGHWEVHGVVIPARQVGGDYFDYFPLGEQRFGVTIADVSGKGVPAAMLMANVQASVRAFCDGERPVPEAVRRINQSVSRSQAGGKFITLFYGEVDLAAGVMRYTNAGHNYPLLRRADGSVEELKDGGHLIGIFRDSEYQQGEVRLAPGDALLLYSDGLSEAADSLGNQFGDDRLLALWQKCSTMPSAQVIGRLFDEIIQFRGSAGQSDDMTAVVIGASAG